MDKVVDHLLVFKGQGEIKDFPGNYTQYRDWQALQSKELSKAKDKVKEEKEPKRVGQTKESNGPRRMSFKEKREFEQLDRDIAALEAEKKEIEDSLCSGKLTVEEITEKSRRLPVLSEELDEKSMRWLELSELS